MFTKQKRTLHIYSAKFTFTQLMEYLSIVAVSEKLLNDEFGSPFYSSIAIYLRENGEYRSPSIEDFINDQQAIEKIKKDKIFKVYITLGDIFKLSCTENYFSIEYRAEHHQSTHLISNAKDILSIRTKNTLLEMCNSNSFAALLGSCFAISTVAYAYDYLSDYSFYTILICFLFLSLVTFSRQSHVKIIMENSKDDFLFRNKDAIIVGVIFYLLGLITTPLMSFGQ
ncbi:hypothetical protein NCCP2140_03430 [Pseudoalteromonas sp. NCCP-2140]|uniref:hypothetical protein n=1 Tax=Pseudoalteromonas sp. NCCP-2140 TaxID=2942288 RepID=UPI00203C15A2|nr:hypothetical protein [Pseudoalteromonas sp. NCCP-2140]GKW51290.1 hypothetical protein NCCP2140_03430 [Pseudoalteromonas sp. NCCP-2140]